MSETDAEPGRWDRLAEHLDAGPWGEGVLAGIGAFVAGYVVFFVVLVATGAVDFGQSVVAVLRSVGHFFYNAHNVPTLTQRRQVVEEDGTVVGELVQRSWDNGITGWRRVHQEVISSGEVVQEGTRTTVQETNSTLPPEVYLLVPILTLLVVAGLFTRYYVDTGAVESPLDATITGLSVAAPITLGYLLVVLLGSYLIAVQGGEGTFVRPSRLEALGYGVLYPFACSAASAGVVIGLEQGEDSPPGPAATESDDAATTTEDHDDQPAES